MWAELIGMETKDLGLCVCVCVVLCVCVLFCVGVVLCAMSTSKQLILGRVPIHLFRLRLTSQRLFDRSPQISIERQREREGEGAR